MFRTGALFVVVVVGCVGEAPNGPSSDGNASADAGTTTEAGTSGQGDASTQDATTGSRSVVCNAKATCTGADRCCGVGIDWIGASCKADCGGAYFLLCDDAADCGAGQVCCYKTDGGARAVASFCASTCRQSEKELQLCSLANPGECLTGSCSPLTTFSPDGLASCR